MADFKVQWPSDAQPEDCLATASPKIPPRKKDPELTSGSFRGCVLVGLLSQIEFVVHAGQDSGRGRFGTDGTKGIASAYRSVRSVDPKSCGPCTIAAVCLGNHSFGGYLTWCAHRHHRREY